MTATAITAVMGGRKVFKRLDESRIDLSSLTRRGLPIEAFFSLAEEMGLDRKRLGAILGISERTLSRRLASGQRLTVEESDRTMRLADVFAKAVDTFGAAAKAGQWMRSPILALGDRIPLQMLDTYAGTKEVEAVLYRIDYGVYS